MFRGWEECGGIRDREFRGLFHPVYLAQVHFIGPVADAERTRPGIGCSDRCVITARPGYDDSVVVFGALPGRVRQRLVVLDPQDCTALSENDSTLSIDSRVCWTVSLRVSTPRRTRLARRATQGSHARHHHLQQSRGKAGTGNTSLVINTKRTTDLLIYNEMSYSRWSTNRGGTNQSIAFSAHLNSAWGKHRCDA